MTARLEQHTLQAILAAFGARDGLRIWRQNTGKVPVCAKCGELVPRRVGGRQNRSCVNCGASRRRFVSYGVAGQADITGVVRRALACPACEAHVADVGQRLEIEVKSPAGAQTDQQRRFKAMTLRHGGLYVLARSTDDVEAALAEEQP